MGIAIDSIRWYDRSSKIENTLTNSNEDDSVIAILFTLYRPTLKNDLTNCENNNHDTS